MQLKHLMYSSVAVGDSASTALSVLDTAAVFNLSRKITGVLVVAAGSFAQILEGGNAEVDDLYSRIVRDPRHTQVKLVAEYPIGTRMWPAWQMSVAAATERNRPIFARYGIVPGRSLADLAAPLLKGLLMEFSEHAVAGRASEEASTRH